MPELTLSLHLSSFPNNTVERKEFHLREVHQKPIIPHGMDLFHRQLHLDGPSHGFSRGVVKAAVR